jgi:SAM-dependent methyltransferase
MRELERVYLTRDDPIEQSGFYGGAERWRRERGIILDAIEGDGDLLDVGCANGYLLECLVQWAREKGITLTPYGVDQGPGLIDLARKRLPQYVHHLWVGNAWNWLPPRTFRYVYALYDCAPAHLLGEYARRLLERCVEGGGRLIIGAYGRRDDAARDVAGDLAASGFAVAGSVVLGEPPVTRLAWVRRR